jgi:hypothetical protein
MARGIVLNFCVYMPTPFPGFSYGPCAGFGGIQCLYLFVESWKSGCRQSPCVRACLMYNAAHRTMFCKAVCALHGRHSFRVTVCPHQTNSTHGCYAVLRGVCNCVLAAGCAAWVVSVFLLLAHGRVCVQVLLLVQGAPATRVSLVQLRRDAAWPHLHQFVDMFS